MINSNFSLFFPRLINVSWKMLEVETEQSNEVQNQGHLPRAEGIEGCLGMWLMWSRSLWTWVPSPWKQNVGAVVLKSIAWDQWRLHNRSPGCPYPHQTSAGWPLWPLWPRIFIFSAPTRVDHPQHELHLVTALVSGGWKLLHPASNSFKKWRIIIFELTSLDRNFLIRDPKE